MHTTGSYYLNADTMAFMQLILYGSVQRLSDFEIDYPAWRWRGAVPLGSVSAASRSNNGAAGARRDLIQEQYFLRYLRLSRQPGINLLAEVVPAENILFASEMVGAVKGVDPRSGHYFDDTKRYVDNALWARRERAAKIFEGNARRAFSRLKTKVAATA